MPFHNATPFHNVPFHNAPIHNASVPLHYVAAPFHNASTDSKIMLTFQQYVFMIEHLQSSMVTGPPDYYNLLKVSFIEHNDKHVFYMPPLAVGFNTSKAHHLLNIITFKQAMRLTKASTTKTWLEQFAFTLHFANAQRFQEIVTHALHVLLYDGTVLPEAVFDTCLRAFLVPIITEWDIMAFKHYLLTTGPHMTCDTTVSQLHSFLAISNNLLGILTQNILPLNDMELKHAFYSGCFLEWRQSFLASRRHAFDNTSYADMVSFMTMQERRARAAAASRHSMPPRHHPLSPSDPSHGNPQRRRTSFAVPVIWHDVYHQHPSADSDSDNDSFSSDTDTTVSSTLPDEDDSESLDFGTSLALPDQSSMTTTTTVPVTQTPTLFTSSDELHMDVAFQSSSTSMSATSSNCPANCAFSSMVPSQVLQSIPTEIHHAIMIDTFVNDMEDYDQHRTIKKSSGLNVVLENEILPEEQQVNLSALVPIPIFLLAKGIGGIARQ
jgi:hypothetical protein